MLFRNAPLLPPRFPLALLAAPVVLFISLGLAGAESPLHEQIDAALEAQAGGAVAGPASDAEFLRRAWFDFAGLPPTASEVRAFLANANPNKRGQLIDRLLAAPSYAVRMQEAITTLCLERREEKSVSENAWRNYLRESFAQNKPWHKLVGELLFAEGEAAKPAEKFLLVEGRKGDPHRTAQDISRLFLGRDILCAQCHDHPTVNTYKQADYYGLLAYFQEQLPGVEFESVFEPGKKTTGPRLPAAPPAPIASMAAPTDAKLAASAAAARRKLAASQLPTAENTLFVRNSVNRFWCQLMGRGLVHPLHDMQAANPPSHPAVLDLLAHEFVQHGFDVKFLLRELALTRAYARASQLPAGASERECPPASYRVFNLRPLSPEQMARGLLQVTGQLAELERVPVPEKSNFTFADYANGRITSPPSNLPDAMKLFVGVFGNGPGETEDEFTPATGQALFLMHERLIMNSLAPRPGSLVEQLAKLDDAAAADELYLSVLSRPATAAERTSVKDYLAKHGSRRPEALGELVWSLMAASEFRLNH